jgi:hypothetical protein
MKVMGELERAQWEQVSTLPTGSGAFRGRAVYLTTTDGSYTPGPYVHNGTAWNQISPQYAHKWPSADGSSNQVLTTNGSAQYSWSSVATANLTVTTKTTTATLATNETGVILASSAGGAYTIALPTAVGNTGLYYKIKKTTSDLSLITIDPNGAQTINGASTYALAFQHEYIEIVADGTNWQIIGSYTPFVGLHYNVNDGDTPTNSTTNYMDYADLVYESHTGLVSGANSGIVTTTNTGFKITSPVDLYWNITATARFAGTFAAGGYVYMAIRVDNVAKIAKFIQTDFGSAGDTPQGMVDGTVYVPATSRIEVELSYVAGGNKSLSTDALQNYITAFARR